MNIVYMWFKSEYYVRSGLLVLQTEGTDMAKTAKTCLPHGVHDRAFADM